jgi:hypothetical protein
VHRDREAGSNTGGRNRASGVAAVPPRTCSPSHVITTSRPPGPARSTHVPRGGWIEVQRRSSRATVGPRALVARCAGARATTGAGSRGDRRPALSRAGADRPRPTAAGSRSTRRRSGDGILAGRIECGHGARELAQVVALGRPRGERIEVHEREAAVVVLDQRVQDRAAVDEPALVEPAQRIEPLAEHAREEGRRRRVLDREPIAERRPGERGAEVRPFAVSPLRRARSASAARHAAQHHGIVAPSRSDAAHEEARAVVDVPGLPRRGERIDVHEPAASRAVDHGREPGDRDVELVPVEAAPRRRPRSLPRRASAVGSSAASPGRSGMTEPYTYGRQVQCPSRSTRGSPCSGGSGTRTRCRRRTRRARRFRRRRGRTD